MRKTILALLPILAVPLLAQTPPAQPQIGGGTCTSATLTGSYSLTLSGRDASSTGTLLSGVAVGVGTATFDGLSKVAFTLTENSVKSLGVAANWSGNYSLQANCVGTISITSGDSATFTLASYDQGVSYVIVGEDGTYAYSGGGNNLPTTCSASLLSGTYSFNGNGFALASSAISGVTDFSGLMQFDGTSVVTTNWFISSGGTITPVTTSGSYTVTSGCTGTATMTDPSGKSYALQFTITNSTGTFVIGGSTPLMVFTGSGRTL
jgi:hypothetical protein